MTKGKKTSIMFVCSLEAPFFVRSEPDRRTYKHTPWGALCLEWSRENKMLLSLTFVDKPLPEDAFSGLWEKELFALLQRSPLRLGAEATVFQMRVWRAAMRIPPGKTVTYGELAAKLGQPAASRAVGRALALNPYALLIPCHRVVPASGGTGEYRWRADRKEAILQAEREGEGAWETVLGDGNRSRSSIRLSSVA